MQFDFTSIIDRTGTGALAVDGLGMPGGFAPAAPQEGFDAIPLWVADMSFAAPSCITGAITRRVGHPLFGYFLNSDAYYDAIIDWHRRRKGVDDLTRECIGYENGVLGGVVSAICAFSAPADKILLHSPTYVGFTGSVERTGRVIEHSPLVLDDEGVWRMDFEDMERRLSENHIHLAIFCSPHNPCGRVWERWEIERAMELFEKYQCTVICDEIWSDLILPGHTHIPVQQVSQWAHDNTIALYAPSKTFNLAGLIGSYHVIYDQRLRDRVRSVSDATHYNSMNVLSQEALVGAYSDEGSAWLDELLQVIDANMTVACDFFAGIDGVSLMRPEGTYMLFVDFAGWLEKHGKTLAELEEAAWNVGVAWQDGAMFHGPTHIRMNLALPTARLEEALDRLRQHVL